MLTSSFPKTAKQLNKSLHSMGLSVFIIYIHEAVFDYSFIWHSLEFQILWTSDSSSSSKTITFISLSGFKWADLNTYKQMS